MRACATRRRSGFAQPVGFEIALMQELRQTARSRQSRRLPFHLHRPARHLKDAGHADALPERSGELLRGLGRDGRSDEGMWGACGCDKA